MTAVLVCALLVGGVPAAPEGFDYGSYGRVSAATDLEGGPGVSTNVVSHGSRLEESPYLELDVYYGHTVDDVRWRVVSSLALTGSLQHFEGFNTQPTLMLRNLYLQGDGIGRPWLSVWAGSRMYRGDDIYLFDFWPLDNLNTIGGGIFIRPPRWELALHAGVNRLDDLYQFQTVPEPLPGAAGTIDQVTLNRERFIESAKFTYFLREGPSGAKLSLYAEAHEIGEGILTHADRTTEKLPSDDGFLVGAQAGVWSPAAFANLFVRGATGLAAYGDTAIPYSVAADKRAADAREFLLGTSAGIGGPRLGVIVGAYLRYFHAAQPATYALDRYWEGIIDARPQLQLTPHFAVAAEVSYQGRSTDALDPVTMQQASPSVFKLSAMPAVLTFAPGLFGRPQLRVVYTASFLSSEARALLSLADTRLSQDTIHYLGIQAEWWFNSAYR